MQANNKIICEIADLEQITFSDAWSKESIFDTFLQDYNQVFLAFDINGELVLKDIPGAKNVENILNLYAEKSDNGNWTFLGYLIANYISDESELLRVAVYPEYRNKHIGTNLIDFYVSYRKDEAINYFLEVRCSNLAARHLYEKYGYSVIGTRKAYYKNPTEDAVLYAMKIDRVDE